MPDNRPQIAVGLIVAEDGRMLLQLRENKRGLPGAGKWGYFGGHIEEGERPSEAFLREMQEELGWRPRHLELYGVRELDRDGWHVTSHAFAAHLDVAVDALVLGEGQALALHDPQALPENVVPDRRDVAAFAASDAYRRMKRRYDVITSTGLLVDREGRFLLQLRDDKPDIVNPGRWGSFGGLVEAGEPPDEGFARELEEELAWRPARFELYGAYPYRNEHGQPQLIYAYAALVDVPKERLTLGEGQDMEFFALDALPPTIVPDLRTLIEHFAQSDVYQSLRSAAAERR